MDKQWDIDFYSAKDGNCEILEWITGLKESHRDKVIAWLDKLQEMGQLLPRPYSDLLDNGIHELRIKISGNQVRILYFFIFENRIVLTHPFYKNVSKVPAKDDKKGYSNQRRLYKKE